MRFWPRQLAAPPLLLRLGVALLCTRSDYTVLVRRVGFKLTIKKYASRRNSDCHLVYIGDLLGTRHDNLKTAAKLEAMNSHAVSCIECGAFLHFICERHVKFRTSFRFPYYQNSLHDNAYVSFHMKLC